MKTRIYAAALPAAAAAVLASAVPALAGSCDGAPAPSVVVNSSRPAPVFDRSRSAADLTAMDRVEPGYMTLGITAVDYASSVRTSVQLRRSGFGSWCGYPVGIVVDYGFAKPPTVYIASDLMEGSCKYAATMEHEMRHVRIHETGLWRARLAVDRAISEAVRTRMPVTARTGEEVSQAVGDIVSEAVDRAVKQVSAGVQSENDAMDTPEAYLAFSNMCRD